MSSSEGHQRTRVLLRVSEGIGIRQGQAQISLRRRELSQGPLGPGQPHEGAVVALDVARTCRQGFRECEVRQCGFEIAPLQGKATALEKLLTPHPVLGIREPSGIGAMDQQNAQGKNQ